MSYTDPPPMDQNDDRTKARAEAAPAPPMFETSDELARPLRPSLAPPRSTGRSDRRAPTRPLLQSGPRNEHGDERETDAFSVSTAIAAAKKHFWLAAAITLVAIFGAAAFALAQTKIYAARATLQIDPKPPTPLGHGVESVVEMGSNNYWANIEYYNTQHSLLSSKPVAEAAVRELGLHLDYSFLANARGPVEPPSERKKPPTIEQATAVVIKRLTVAPKKESRLVEVAYEDADPERAARILDAVLRAYVAHNMNRTLDSTSSAVEWLGEQLQGLKSDLTDSEQALHQYKLDKQIASIGLDSQANLLAREMAQLNEERTKVQADIQRASARLTQLNQIKSDDPSSIPQTVLMNSTELGTLRSDYVDSTRERNALLGAGKGENHPEVQSASARVTETGRALAGELKNIQVGAQRELAALQQQAGGLAALLKTAEAEALDLNLMDIEYSRLKRTKDNNEKLYSLVLERSKEAGLTQMLRVNNIQVLAAPVASEFPVKPQRALIVGVGALLGLAFGFGAALLREQLDQTLKSPADLETLLGLAPLGALPALGAKGGAGASKSRRRRSQLRALAPERLVEREPNGGFAEALRAVRTNLLLMSPDEPFHRLLITSAGPSEGKTTVACSLAIAMAQAGHRVLLVDCDLRKPRVHTIFSEMSTPRSTVSQSLIAPQSLLLSSLVTDVPNLSVLPAGPTPPNPSELLHSEAFGHLLDRLSQHYDLVLLDSPPLVVTDAAIMSARVDGAILVVRALQTERAAATRAIRSLNDVGAHVVGGVLNAMSVNRSNAAYGYGYGYGYNSGSSAEASAASRPNS